MGVIPALCFCKDLGKSKCNAKCPMYEARQAYIERAKAKKQTQKNEGIENGKRNSRQRQT